MLWRQRCDGRARGLQAERKIYPKINLAIGQSKLTINMVRKAHNLSPLWTAIREKYWPIGHHIDQSELCLTATSTSRQLCSDLYPVRCSSPSLHTMLSRASALRRAAYSLSRAANVSAPRRTLAEAAVAAEGSKLKFSFFLPHDAIKKDVEVVRFLHISIRFASNFG